MYAGLVKKEETWYDVTTASPALWADWASGDSDGSYSDCAQLDIKTGEGEEGGEIFLDNCCDDTAGSLLKDNCKFELCPVCMFPEFPVDLQLRGVCLASPVEKFYLLHNSTELHGHGGSVLSWAAPEQIWRIRTSNFQSLVTLQSGGGGGDLPLGINQWHFSDSDCSDPGKQTDNCNN